MKLKTKKKILTNDFKKRRFLLEEKVYFYLNFVSKQKEAQSEIKFKKHCY